MSRFQIVINWSAKGEIKDTIIDCVKVPINSDINDLKGIFDVFLNNINSNLNTSEKCLNYMLNNTIGPFIYNYIDRVYKINYIDIATNISNNFIFNRDNENFIVEFNQYFEIIREYQDKYSWRLNDTI